jgi:hypothetical protein
LNAYYIAANLYEGCGHKHRSMKTAKRCLPRIEDRGEKGVWRITNDGNKIDAVPVFKEGIDLTDIPEVKDWSGAVRGRFYHEPKRNL